MENKRVIKYTVLLIAAMMLIGMTACSPNNMQAADTVPADSPDEPSGMVGYGSKSVYVFDGASFDISAIRIPDWAKTNFASEKPSYGEIRTARKAAQCFEDVWADTGWDVMQERPYIVSYDSGKWYVRGSMEELCPGGVAHAVFSDSGELLAAWGEE